MSDNKSRYRSVVLRTNVCDDTCLVCRFLNGDQSTETLLGVISILDSELAGNEAYASQLAKALEAAVAERHVAEKQ